MLMHPTAGAHEGGAADPMRGAHTGKLRDAVCGRQGTVNRGA